MYKILIADDESIVLQSLKYIIKEKFGDSCEIECAKTGRSVIEAAETFRPDIAFMDIHMPGMNGYQATEKIRNIGGTRIWMPIVAMTADAFESDVHHALRVGMNAFISKPVNLNTLKLVVERFVGRPGGVDGR